jgi:Fe-S-cluster-containing hydrogenase component 2
MAVKVIVEKFKKHQCPAVAACPVGAISQKDENSPPVVDATKCIECGSCTAVCPNGEFVLEE